MCTCLCVCAFVMLCAKAGLIPYTAVIVQSGSSRKDVHMLFPEEEKIIVEETRSNGQTVVEER